jgi:hypothetical protein
MEGRKEFSALNSKRPHTCSPQLQREKNSVQMKPHSCIFLGTAALLAVCFPAQGIDARYIWCSLHDQRSTTTTAYFSEVFEGDASNSDFFTNAFSAWVHANYTDVHGAAACTSASDRPAATADRDHEKDTERNIATGTIIQTDWTYAK